MKEKVLEFRVEQPKPLLSTKHKTTRLEFCRKYENWTYKDWRRDIFSDFSKTVETKVELYRRSDKGLIYMGILAHRDVWMQIYTIVYKILESVKT